MGVSHTAKKRSPLRSILESETFYHYRRDPSAIILTALLIAVFGRVLAPQNPYDLTQLDIANGYLPPAWMEDGDPQFLLGTDAQGRCILSSIIYGSASSMLIGVVGMVLSCILGTTLGLISGYSDGVLGSVVMRIADVQLSFPSMFIALVILAIMGQGVDKLLVALVITGWVTYARTVRGADRQKDGLYIRMQDYWAAEIHYSLAACAAERDFFGSGPRNDPDRKFHTYRGHAEFFGGRRTGHPTLSGPAGKKRI